MLFSIIIPTYNRKDLLLNAVNSIINQNNNNWELIIVDNYSTDGTEEAIKFINEPKIKFYKNLKTGLVAKSINMGIKKAQGEWIGFLDSDDTYDLDKLNIVQGIIAKNDVDVIYHDLKKIYENKKKTVKIMKGEKLQEEITKNILINGCNIFNSSVLVKKKKLFEVNLISEDRHLSQTYDLDLWLKLSTVTNKFHYISKSLGSYLIHKNNFQDKDTDISIKESKTMSKFLKYLNSKEIKIYQARLNYKKSRYYYKKNDKINSINNALLSLKNGSLKIKIFSLITIIQNFLKK
jgi:glycosyltransferase involved in cell wall biosynthesis